VTAAECAACEELFTGITSFDRHQDRDYTRTPAVICRPPAECGLVQNEHGRWGTPLDEAGRAYFASRAASRGESPADPVQENPAPAAAKARTGPARTRPDGLGHSVRRLDLIRKAKDSGLSWAAIGATLGVSGRQAKRDAHKLAARVQRELLLSRRNG
jgi:hypothetical protein